MGERYCYWSVADGPYGAMMEHCVRTARAAGVFKEFHVLTDRPLEGCECYDAFQSDKANGLFKLHYLRVGMTRLLFDYFIWIDADSVFVRNPVNILDALAKSPLHVPLELNLSALRREATVQHPPSANGDTVDVEKSPGANGKLEAALRLRDLFEQEGIANQAYLSGSAFWIIHREAIEPVYDLAMGFWHKAKAAGLTVDVSAALGYAMQILCADPEAHQLTARPDLWASDDLGVFANRAPDGKPWAWRHPLAGEPVEVHPAIIHLTWTRPVK